MTPYALYDHNQKRRIKELRVSASFIVGLATQGNRINALCEQGIPDGARIVGICAINQAESFSLYLEHDTFPETETPDPIDVMFRSFHCPECGKWQT